ncbi:MAG: HAD family hydrolase [Bacillota bacterium]|nr:HAD family hydrolase [Bacillota bacterium]
MIKLIASDMDGTLVNDEGKISDNIYRLINTLHDKNIKFAAASGRFYSQLCKNFKNVKSNIIIISHNGALVKYKNDDRTIFSSPLKDEYVEHILNLKREFGEEILIATANNAFALNPKKEIYEAYKSWEIPVKLCASPQEITCPIYRITYFNPEGVKNETIKYLENNLSPNLGFVVSGSKWIDIANKGTSKGNALRIIQDKYDIKKKNTMVFGDYYNDVTMFQAADFSYAMENAPDDVKDKARFIAGSNNENGVYNVIYEYASSI